MTESPNVRPMGSSTPPSLASPPTSSVRRSQPSADGKPVKVTRAQVRAAKGRIQVDRQLGRETPDWIRRVAAAKPPRAH